MWGWGLFFFVCLQLFHIFISVPTLEVTSFLHQPGTSWSCPSLTALSLTALVCVSWLAGFQNVHLDSEQSGKSGDRKGSMQRGKAVSPSAAGLCVMSYSEPKPVSPHLTENAENMFPFYCILIRQKKAFNLVECDVTFNVLNKLIMGSFI